ncbi:MAG: hypothetical protein CTY31_12570 [Hyphomicrobium sp.]|nr:MAG: hypothetical protein CTY39_04465 [Hyphomicrobium sp.]PPC98593.1 MAG: hypothetical protein CTY31_12570 [Hyphomicrobium sp.]
MLEGFKVYGERHEVLSAEKSADWRGAIANFMGEILKKNHIDLTDRAAVVTMLTSWFSGGVVAIYIDAAIAEAQRPKALGNVAVAELHGLNKFGPVELTYQDVRPPQNWQQHN